MTCRYCRHEIGEAERRFYSRQAGMKGYYHWKCFVEACRQANRAGAQEIETISVNEDAFTQYSSYDNLGSG